jgi:hypothetical protein
MQETEHPNYYLHHWGIKYFIIYYYYLIKLKMPFYPVAVILQ